MSISVRRFTAADVPLGMTLKNAAGWNQTEADWHRAIVLEPEGCFVGLCDGTAAATLTTCRFGSIAWIAMVLTDPAFRGRGLASALVERSIAYLEGCGTRSIRLDATALGRPVYEKFGFVVDGEATRFFGRATENAAVSEISAEMRVQPIDDSRLAAVAEFDCRTTGNDRGRLLECLQRESPQWAQCVLRGDDVVAYGLARRGSRAVQIGPCSAVDATTGRQLCDAIGAGLRDRDVYIDVPGANRAAIDAIQLWRVREERRFSRMTRGEPVVENVMQIWANFGPEKG